MTTWLFQSFLDNPAEYQRAQQHWERLFRNSLPRIYPYEQLTINNFNNPNSDGNPIFAGICRSLQLAVRVIQQPVGEPDDIDLDCWVDSISSKPGGLGIRELVISCCPSEENLPDVKRILSEWFTRGKIDPLGYLNDDQLWRGNRSSSSPELCIR